MKVVVILYTTTQFFLLLTKVSKVSSFDKSEQEESSQTAPGFQKVCDWAKERGIYDK